MDARIRGTGTSVRTGSDDLPALTRAGERHRI